MSEYKLVPVEPTPEMRRKAGLTRGADYYTITKVWRAMLAAAPDHIADTRKMVASDVQGEPVAWIRRWSLDGEKPSKERNKNGRMAYPMKYKLHEVTRNRCLPDDVALYTAPQPAEQQPDVTQLVQALEQCITSMLDSGYRTNAVVIRAARAALSAYRKGDQS